MSFEEDLKKQVNTDITEEEKYCILVDEIKHVSKMPEDKARTTLIEAMKYTGTWINVPSLKNMLGEEDFANIEKEVLSTISKRYEKALEKEPEKRQLVEQEVIPKDIEETFFAIIKQEKGYVLREAPYGMETYPMDIEKIKLENLKGVITTSMKKHLESGVFHDRDKIKAKWIEGILENTINSLSNENKDKEKDKSNIIE